MISTTTFGISNRLKSVETKIDCKSDHNGKPVYSLQITFDFGNWERQIISVSGDTLQSVMPIMNLCHACQAELVSTGDDSNPIATHDVE